MTDALEDHEGAISIGSKAITNLRFADDIDGLAGVGEEMADQYKLMTDNTSGIDIEFKVNGQKFEAVTSFKYVGSVITDEGSKTDTVQDSTDASSIDEVEISLFGTTGAVLSVPRYD